MGSETVEDTPETLHTHPHEHPHPETPAFPDRIEMGALGRQLERVYLRIPGAYAAYEAAESKLLLARREAEDRAHEHQALVEKKDSMVRQMGGDPGLYVVDFEADALILKTSLKKV